MEHESSVATFAETNAGQSVALGEGHYEIRSFVDETRPEGATHRRAFTCRIRFDGQDWQLEALELEALDRVG